MSGALASRTRPLLHIAAGTKFSLACGAHAGDVVGWGDGSKGQLGIGASAIEGRHDACLLLDRQRRW